MYLVDPTPAPYRCIPIHPAGEQNTRPVLAADGEEGDSGTWGPPTRVADALGRVWQDLRISVTDQCNFRCRYCMPKEVFGRNYPFLPSSALLSFGEIGRVAAAAMSLGVRKIRLTGGEPLLRKHIEHLVGMLAQQADARNQALEIAMTSNGVLLPSKARGLRAAGLDRITVSLDALEESVFQHMNGVGVSVARVLAGIDAALQAGFERVKVNVVVRRGWNESQILPLARHFEGMPVSLRFIEFMDVGHSNAWSMAHVVPGADIVRLLQTEFDLLPLAPANASETAKRWRYATRNAAAGQSEIGLINSVTGAFCRDCNRARLTADGKLFTCLFAGSGLDVLPYLRGNPAGHAPHGLARVLHAVWARRDDRYSELRGHGAIPERSGKAEMNYLGG